MSTAIPNGTYIRILFDEPVSFFLQKISEQLQQNTGGSFYSQMDPRSGRGCHPFHIKLITSVEQTVLSCEQICDILRHIGDKYEAVHGSILPVCDVNMLGQVSLKVSCRDCIMIGRELHQLLPGSSDYLSRVEENLEVIIGLFTGSHIAAFEDWLNKELSVNSAVFPLFRGGLIEVNDENRSFTSGAIRLVGKPRARKSIVPLLESDTPPSTPSSSVGREKAADFIDNFAARNIINDLKEVETVQQTVAPSSQTSSQPSFSQSQTPFRSVSVGEQTIEQRLLTSTLTHCKKITEAGEVLATITPGVDYDVIAPVDCELLKRQCAKIFCMIDGLLKAVGPKEFLSALDAATNPSELRLSEELRSLVVKGVRTLELIQAPDMRIKVCKLREAQWAAVRSGSVSYGDGVTSTPASADSGGKLAIVVGSLDIGDYGVNSGSGLVNRNTGSPLLCFPVNVEGQYWDATGRVSGSRSQQAAGGGGVSGGVGSGKSGAGLDGTAGGEGSGLDSSTMRDRAGFNISVGVSGGDSQNGSHGPGACLALNIRADALKKWGIEPIDGHMFCLPFGWIGTRDWKMFKKGRSDTIGSAGSGSGSGWGSVSSASTAGLTQIKLGTQQGPTVQGTQPGVTVVGVGGSASPVVPTGSESDDTRGTAVGGGGGVVKNSTATIATAKEADQPVAGPISYAAKLKADIKAAADATTSAAAAAAAAVVAVAAAAVSAQGKIPGHGSVASVDAAGGLSRSFSAPPVLSGSPGAAGILVSASGTEVRAPVGQPALQRSSSDGSRKPASLAGVGAHDTPGGVHSAGNILNSNGHIVGGVGGGGAGGGLGIRPNNKVEMMPGDWLCPACGLIVYARKAACPKCRTCKPEGAALAAAMVTASDGCNVRRVEVTDMRKGDWICSICTGHNFASKTACYKCRNPRPPFNPNANSPLAGLSPADANQASSVNRENGGMNGNGNGSHAESRTESGGGGGGGGGGASPAVRAGVKRGDWECPNCGENVFAKRDKCFKCSTPKPH